MFGFVVPFMYSEFRKEKTVIALSISSITMGILAVLEMVEIKNSGLKYFSSVWNYFDIILILSWFSFYIIRYTEGFSTNGILIDLTDDFTDNIILINMLKVFIIFLNFLKIISYCRVFEGFASLIMLLQIVMSDLKYFQIFFFLLIILFTLLQRILSV